MVDLSSFCADNKILAIAICAREKAKIPKAMRLNAREFYFEIGVVYPREHWRSNEFTPIDYNQGDIEFRTNANNACEYYFRITEGEKKND